MRSAMICGLLLAIATTARAQVQIDEAGGVEQLGPAHAHQVAVSDGLERIALVDLDAARLLGILTPGYGAYQLEASEQRDELYLPETFYSRGSRGERTDVVTIYDRTRLVPVGEVVLPPRRAINALATGNVALGDDERFLAVFNLTPASSLSIVDLSQRTLVAETPSAGCGLAYAAGPRRFAMLCADGSLLLVPLAGDGQPLETRRSKPFFDPQADPVTESAVRQGDEWLFVSFDGWVHPVDVAGPELEFAPAWSLFDERDRQDAWRVGGGQHLAIHPPSGRLYALVHQGEPRSFKEPGTQVWVYDLASQALLQRIELRHPGLTYMGTSLEFGRSWIWPFNGLYEALLGLLPPGISHLVVTQDDQPLLVTGGMASGSVAVYDALSGEFLRRVSSGNASTLALRAPWLGTAR